MQCPRLLAAVRSFSVHGISISLQDVYTAAVTNAVIALLILLPEMRAFGLEGDVVLSKKLYIKKIEDGSCKQDPNDLIEDAVESLKRGDYNITVL